MAINDRSLTVTRPEASAAGHQATAALNDQQLTVTRPEAVAGGSQATAALNDRQLPVTRPEGTAHGAAATVVTGPWLTEAPPAPRAAPPDVALVAVGLEVTGIALSTAAGGQVIRWMGRSPRRSAPTLAPLAAVTHGPIVAWHVHPHAHACRVHNHEHVHRMDTDHTEGPGHAHD